MQIYVVQPNDTVDSIAETYGISVDSIIYNNQIPYPYSLALGQALLLSIPSEFSYNRFVSSGGYAYPFITPEVLEESLPYLSSLYVFSYGFTADGTLVPPELDDTFMITTAIEYGTAPILTLTPFGPDGMFNNNLITALVNSPEAINNLINQITVQITQRNFQGVDIDFEYILPEDKFVFVDFVRQVKNAVNLLGYPVSVALAPKTSDTQAGLLYEGKDYALLGDAANYVLLMTYEWGFTYGPPMAVAPINNVRQVVEYALSRIPPQKINLGIPNYGYDWTLPFERGISKADTISNTEAVQIAIAHDVPILFDEVAQSPYFYYEDNGVSHEVWFEDVRSLAQKFSLIAEYSLHGLSYWTIMNLFRANFLLLADRFRIEK